METKPYSLQAPEQIAKDYGGNKQKIAEAMQIGVLDPTAGTLAGMFIDRMRAAAQAEQAPQQTVAQQVFAHECLASYSLESKCRIVFLSSDNVFDAYSQYPSYEYDKTLSNSIYGHFKIKIENILMRLPEKQWVIARLPMVFGLQSPRLTEIKEHLINDVPVEVFPNLIVNITTDQKLSQQIHYIINQNLNHQKRNSSYMIAVH